MTCFLWQAKPLFVVVVVGYFFLVAFKVILLTKVGLAVILLGGIFIELYDSSQLFELMPVVVQIMIPEYATLQFSEPKMHSLE